MGPSLPCIGKKKLSNWPNPIFVWKSTFWQTLCGFGKPVPFLSWPIKAPKLALASFIYIKKCQPGKGQWDFHMVTKNYRMLQGLWSHEVSTHTVFSDASEAPWQCFCLHQKVQPTRLMFQLQEQKTLLWEPHDFMGSSLGFDECFYGNDELGLRFRFARFLSMGQKNMLKRFRPTLVTKAPKTKPVIPVR